MIEKVKAVEIARKAIEQKLGFFPEDAVISHAYLSGNRWVIRWKRETSEIDHLIVWVSADTGEVLRTDIRWKEQPEMMPAGVDLRPHIAHLVRQKHGISVDIIGYKEIAKEKYNFFIPPDERKDYYWIGMLDNRKLLIDTDGTVVGELVLPSLSASGHCFNPAELECVCWDRMMNKFASFFRKWTGTSITGCLPALGCADSYMEYEDYENAIKSPDTELYCCIAHGAWYAYWFIPYTDESKYTPEKIAALMENRPPMRLAFLIHCEAMDNTGEGTLEYVFRKGETAHTTIIGLSHTTNESWLAFYDFVDYFLNDIDTNRKKPIGDAFEDAVDLAPDIRGHIALTGDATQTLDDIVAPPARLPSIGVVSLIGLVLLITMVVMLVA